MPDHDVLTELRKGGVIPAVPLALDEKRRFDVRHQRALIRYYASAGAIGIAVAVHTTQFEIRDSQIKLFEPVLKVCAEAAEEAERVIRKRLVKIAGVCGNTRQARVEAALAKRCGYDAVLLSLAGLARLSVRRLLDHCKRVAEVAPLVGFYLQPAVGGRVLAYEFWREFVEIENVVAIKIAPFNRYHTLDVVRAVCNAGRDKEIALYTGNDDNIVADLTTPFAVDTRCKGSAVYVRGGLLGQFSVWTRTAVRLLHEIHEVNFCRDDVPKSLLVRGAQLTDANAAIFDAANNFRGCIPGINEVLRRQGLLRSRLCLDPALDLSPGQAEEITRVSEQYPWLPDDAFVSSHLQEWLD
ncbi:MAG: dihydrodipicolinate synthase family protein [Candidatus Sumerlaeaceae bacterium]|jgi:dihydrodipicolinate synthase/N-acetylneuraminate lyase